MNEVKKQKVNQILLEVVSEGIQQYESNMSDALQACEALETETDPKEIKGFLTEIIELLDQVARNIFSVLDDAIKLEDEFDDTISVEN